MATCKSVLAACIVAAIVPQAGAFELRSAAEGWTAVTISLSGWGAARAPSLNAATALALKDCRARSHGASDCGAEIKTIRSGWILALRCGGYRVLASGDTLEDAQEDAAHRILQLKYISNIDLPKCIRVLQGPAEHPDAFDTRPLDQVSRDLRF
jgi:hypothetical protein